MLRTFELTNAGAIRTTSNVQRLIILSVLHDATNTFEHSNEGGSNIRSNVRNIVSHSKLRAMNVERPIVFSRNSFHSDQEYQQWPKRSRTFESTFIASCSTGRT